MTRYIELQYHGKLDMSCVESLTFRSFPENYISKDLIKKLQNIGIEIWYDNGTDVILY